jgi:hypothetical protein
MLKVPLSSAKGRLGSWNPMKAIGRILLGSFSKYTDLGVTSDAPYRSGWVMFLQYKAASYY